jgi:hypothetical protein
MADSKNVLEMIKNLREKLRGLGQTIARGERAEINGGVAERDIAGTLSLKL